MGEYVITNPASVDAKESTARAVAGAAAGVLERWCPPIPAATTNAMRHGIHMTRSYLPETGEVSAGAQRRVRDGVPCEDLDAAERDLRRAGVFSAERRKEEGRKCFGLLGTWLL